MLWLTRSLIYIDVVPNAGTWIEIYTGFAVRNVTSRSFPTRERGLKFIGIGQGKQFVESFPTRERGLKFHAIKKKNYG